MAPFKCPACKMALGSSNSRSIAQHDRQCKSKRKTDNILLQSIKGLWDTLDKSRQRKERRKRRKEDTDNKLPAEIPAEVSSCAVSFIYLLSLIKLQDVSILDIQTDELPLPIDDNVPLATACPRHTLRIPEHLRDLIPTDTGPICMGQYSQLNLSSRPMRQRTPTPPPVEISQSPSPPP